MHEYADNDAIMVIITVIILRIILILVTRKAWNPVVRRHRFTLHSMICRAVK